MHANRFGNQALDLPEDWALSVGAIESLRPNGLPADKASFDQLSYLALDRLAGNICEAGELAAEAVAHVGLSGEPDEHIWN